MQPKPMAALAALLAAVTACAHAQHASGRYFDLVNATHDRVTSFEVAPAGSAAFQGIDIGPPLRGGHAWTTVRIDGGDCLRDFRVGFHDGRTLVYPGIDVCRYGRLRMTPGDAGPSRVATRETAAGDRVARDSTAP